MSDDIVSVNFLTESKLPVWYVKPGETIFNKGEAPKEFYLIQSGQVEIQLGNRLLATLETNGIFGEMAPIDSTAAVLGPSPKPMLLWSLIRRKTSSCL
jgi:CRP-like cAMP-binding protein